MGNISLDNINSYDTDYKNDICNDVYERVIAEFKEKINQMLPEIIDNIKNEIKSEYQNNLNALNVRIDKLEKSVATSVKPPTVLSDILKRQNEIKSEYQNNLNALNVRIDKLEKSVATSVKPPTVLSDILKRQDVNNGFRYGDWIFYINKDNADFLYKVKKDGSQNIQLTDFSVAGFFNIKNGYLHFRDAFLGDKKIKL